MLEFSAMHSVSKYGLGRDVACLPPFPLLLKVLHIGSAFSSEGLSNHQPTVILKKSVTGKNGQRVQSDKIEKYQNGKMAACVCLSPQCKNTAGFDIGLFSITHPGYGKLSN